jgi:predicted RNase H-like HicB family nuclease
MRFYTFEIIIEKEPGEQGYSAYTPALAGCFCRATSLDEVRRNIHEAIQTEVASLLAAGRPIGQSERVVHVAELVIAVPEAEDGSGGQTGLDVSPNVPPSGARTSGPANTCPEAGREARDEALGAIQVAGNRED